MRRTRLVLADDPSGTAAELQAVLATDREVVEVGRDKGALVGRGEPAQHGSRRGRWRVRRND